MAAVSDSPSARRERGRRGAAFRRAPAAADAVDATSAASARLRTRASRLVVDRIDYVIMVPLLYLSVLALLVGRHLAHRDDPAAPANPYNLRLYPGAQRPRARRPRGYIRHAAGEDSTSPCSGFSS